VAIIATHRESGPMLFGNLRKYSTSRLMRVVDFCQGVLKPRGFQLANALLARRHVAMAYLALTTWWNCGPRCPLIKHCEDAVPRRLVWGISRFTQSGRTAAHEGARLSINLTKRVGEVRDEAFVAGLVLQHLHNFWKTLMAHDTNIQWADSITNFIMGCLGCELYLPPHKILAAIDRACLQAGESRWTRGTAQELFGVVLEQAWASLENSVTGPGPGHRKEITTTNIRHLRKRLKCAIIERFSPEVGQMVLSTIERSMKCYAAQLNANRGFDLENPQRRVNVGYAPTFEEITYFPGRAEDAAHWSDLSGTERSDKPWLNGLPRLIFVSDMGDAFSRKQDFEFLRSEMAAFQTPEGQRHLWLWLTKRPEVMRQFADSVGGFPANVCAMTTVTSTKTLGRVDALRNVKAVVRGLSLEPLWEPLADKIDLTGIDWVIVGGESGAKANVELFPVEWATELRDRCREEGVAFFLKQLGRRPICQGNELKLRHPHGGDWLEWPAELRVREMPHYFYTYAEQTASV